VVIGDGVDLGGKHRLKAHSLEKRFSPIEEMLVIVRKHYAPNR